MPTPAAIPQDVSAKFHELAARLIRETCELAELQDSGSIDRQGWRPAPPP